MKSYYKTAIWFAIASILGLTAAFQLTLEKFATLADPDHSVACDFSVIVQCSANLDSAQGAIFGFPNPLIGLIAWPFVLVTGVLLYFNVKLPKIYWGLFLAGNLFGILFVAWLISQSIYVLGTLCPWCMVTWIAMIPTFFTVLFHSGAEGLFSQGNKEFFQRLKSYIPAISLGLFALIALLAQLRLDWVGSL